jgi:prepilin-type N-terminal cleavage/methylation domain-containing protein
MLRSPPPACADRRGGDDGVTLAELVVAMTIMAIAGTVSTAGMVQIYRTLNAFEAQTTSQQQLTTSYERLDRELRYATAVSQPGTVGADYYVEYLIGQTGTPTCVELRLQGSTKQLQRRTWPNGSPASASTWLPLASGISVITDASGQPVAPFQLTAATAVLNYERLQVSLNSTQGTGTTASIRQLIATWAVMNADRNAATDVCTDGRPTS